MPDLWTLIAWVVAATVLVVGASFLGVGVSVAVVILILVAITLGGTGLARRARRARGLPAHGFSPTAELFLDPATGDVTRVYVNASGERRYVVER